MTITGRFGSTCLQPAKQIQPFHTGGGIARVVKIDERRVEARGAHRLERTARVNWQARPRYLPCQARGAAQSVHPAGRRRQEGGVACGVCRNPRGDEPPMDVELGQLCTGFMVRVASPTVQMLGAPRSQWSIPLASGATTQLPVRGATRTGPASASFWRRCESCRYRHIDCASRLARSLRRHGRAHETCAELALAAQWTGADKPAPSGWHRIRCGAALRPVAALVHDAGALRLPRRSKSSA